MPSAGWALHRPYCAAAAPPALLTVCRGHGHTGRREWSEGPRRHSAGISIFLPNRTHREVRLSWELMGSRGLAGQGCSVPEQSSCCSAMANWGLACVDQAPSQPRSASGSRRKRRDQEAAVPHNSSHRPQDSWLMVMDSSAMSCPAMAPCWRTSTVTPWHNAWSSAARNSQAQPSPPTRATKGLAGSTARRQPSPSR